MGEEYGETTPFQYHNHHRPQLAEAVRWPQRRFPAFDWKAMFRSASRIDFSPLRSSVFPLARGASSHSQPFTKRFYASPRHQLAQMAQTTITDYETACTLLVLRQSGTNFLAMLMHFGKSPAKN